MNPFAPGMARRPLLIAGREETIASFFGGLDQAKAGLGGPFTVFVGLRGMGKTTLLAELADRAESRGWVTERFEANPLVECGFASQLLTAAPRMVDRLPDLARLCDITTGYPYLIQVAGACVWDVKAAAVTITSAHVALAEPQTARTLDAGIYRARWERTTPGERLQPRSSSAVLHAILRPIRACARVARSRPASECLGTVDTFGPRLTQREA
jgi:hypothetical protein